VTRPKQVLRSSSSVSDSMDNVDKRDGELVVLPTFTKHGSNTLRTMTTTTITITKRSLPAVVTPTSTDQPSRRRGRRRRIQSGRLLSPLDQTVSNRDLLQLTLVVLANLLVLLVVWICLCLEQHRRKRRARARTTTTTTNNSNANRLRQRALQRRDAHSRIFQLRRRQDEQEEERRRDDDNSDVVIGGGGSDTLGEQQLLNVEIEMAMAELRRTMYLTNFRQEAVVTVRTWRKKGVFFGCYMECRDHGTAPHTRIVCVCSVD
jgi:hypothetical protein